MKTTTKGELNMPYTKIGSRHQVTIPINIFKKLNLQEGGLLEAVEQKGSILLVPKQVTSKPAVPRLNKEEQKIVIEAKKKIKKICTDLINSVGLNDKEIEVAVKTGLIDQDQSYWWYEDWQKGEREAERDIANGNLIGPFDNIEDALKSLKTA